MCCDVDAVGMSCRKLRILQAARFPAENMLESYLASPKKQKMLLKSWKVGREIGDAFKSPVINLVRRLLQLFWFGTITSNLKLNPLRDLLMQHLLSIKPFNVH